MTEREMDRLLTILERIEAKLDSKAEGHELRLLEQRVSAIEAQLRATPWT